MKKIPTLFLRDPKTHQLGDEVHPEATWVIAGEGTPTRKYDGMTVLIREGRSFKRITLKPGMKTPDGFEPAQEVADEITGELPGWVPVGDGAEDAYLREAVRAHETPLADGTYEAVGPKINGNPEGTSVHLLVRHGADVLDIPARDLASLRTYLADGFIEGIVWHHPDGRMVKLKGKDFGIRRARRWHE